MGIIDRIRNMFGAGVDGVTSINAGELHARIEDGEALYLLDVRTRGEYEAGHIPGTQNAPLGPDFQAAIAELPADQPIVCVCASGGRSFSAARHLSGAGFGEVYNLQGGTYAWRAAGHPIDSGTD